MYYFSGNRSRFGQGGYSYSPITIDPLLGTCYPQNLQPAQQIAGKIDSTLAQAADALNQADPKYISSYGSKIDDLRNKLYTHLEAHSHGGCGCTAPNDRQMCEQLAIQAEQLANEVRGLPKPPPPAPVSSPSPSIAPGAPIPSGVPTSAPDDFFVAPLLEPEPEDNSYIVIGGVIFIAVAIALFFLVR